MILIPKNNRVKSPYGTSRKFQQQNNNFAETNDNLLDLNSKNNSNRNSVVRKNNSSFSRFHSGQNTPMEQRNIAQNSSLRPFPAPNQMPPRINPAAPQNATMGFPNLGAQVPPNMNHKFNNLPSMRPNLQYQKAWNSTSRENPNLAQNSRN